MIGVARLKKAQRSPAGSGTWAQALAPLINQGVGPLPTIHAPSIC